jgi:hypothetical protein
MGPHSILRVIAKLMTATSVPFTLSLPLDLLFIAKHIVGASPSLSLRLCPYLSLFLFRFHLHFIAKLMVDCSEFACNLGVAFIVASSLPASFTVSLSLSFDPAFHRQAHRQMQ